MEASERAPRTKAADPENLYREQKRFNRALVSGLKKLVEVEIKSDHTTPREPAASTAGHNLPPAADLNIPGEPGATDPSQQPVRKVKRMNAKQHMRDAQRQLKIKKAATRAAEAEEHTAGVEDRNMGKSARAAVRAAVARAEVEPTEEPTLRFVEAFDGTTGNCFTGGSSRDVSRLSWCADTASTLGARFPGRSLRPSVKRRSGAAGMRIAAAAAYRAAYLRSTAATSAGVAPGFGQPAAAVAVTAPAASIEGMPPCNDSHAATTIPHAGGCSESGTIRQRVYTTAYSLVGGVVPVCSRCATTVATMGTPRQLFAVLVIMLVIMLAGSAGDTDRLTLDDTVTTDQPKDTGLKGLLSPTTAAT
jgi:hypothetical protein